MAVVRIEQTNATRLTIEQDRESVAIDVKEDLALALGLLRKMNALQFHGGMPLYRSRMYEGKSTWAFHQHFIFWAHLRYFVQYRAVYEWLDDHDVSEVWVDPKLAALQTFLTQSGVHVVNAEASVGLSWKHRVALAMAKVSSFVALWKMRLLKTKVLVYTPDKYSAAGCDFRFAPVYQYLRKKGIGFVEVFHTLLDKSFAKHMWKRKRPALYVEAFHTEEFAPAAWIDEVDLSSIDSPYRGYVRFLLREIDVRAQQSIAVIPKMKQWLGKTSLKTFVAIDDVRYTNELIVACQSLGITAYGIQHGQFTKYHVGWYNYDIAADVSVAFDTLFVWNSYWQQVLLEYSTQYTKDNAVVGGWLRRLSDYSFTTPAISSVSDITVLVPFESFAAKDEVVPYIKRLQSFGVSLLFSVRPDWPVAKQLALYGIDDVASVKVITKIDEEALGSFHAVLGSYSTFLNELMYYEKPILFMNTSFDLGHRLVDDNLVIPIDLHITPDQLLALVQQAASKKTVAWPDSPAIETLFDRLF